MPSVINGIGTWQYGKKNLTSRVGTCTQCGNSAKLDSYDTREYFVVFFIPLIPLGRYHNIDHCSRCNRWKQSGQAAWEKVKESNLKQRLEEFAAAPNDYKAAIQLYASYNFFQKREEAATLLKHVREQFANEPEAMLFVGQALYDERQMKDARECFERALALDPTSIVAKRGIILSNAESGKLDEARASLGEFIQSTHPDSQSLVKYVALKFQLAKRHREAREILQALQNTNPGIVKDAGFRKAVRASDKALGQPTTMPAEPWTFSKVFWPALAALIVVGVLVANYVIARNRTLYLVSALEKAVTVQVDGNAVSVAPGGMPSVNVGEGVHHIKVLGAAPEEFDVTVATGYFGRFFNSPVFVVDVAGSA